MSIIKTDLITAATDAHGNLDLDSNKAFCGVFNLGLVLGSKHAYDKRFPTDETGLQLLKARLQSLEFECFSGLAGIGAIIGAADPVELDKPDLANLGIAITHLAKLGVEARDYSENIQSDLDWRNGYLTNPEQAALHAELHVQAQTAQQLDGMDYLKGIQLAVNIMAHQSEQATLQGGN